MLRRLQYLERPVIALDGEGVTVNGVHRYILIQASTGELLRNDDGIPTAVAFRWLQQLATDYPDAMFVSFGFGYDANNIIKDIPVDHLTTLRRDEYVIAGTWRIWWRPGKYFGIGGNGQNITIWDLRSFQRGSFSDAASTFLGHVPESIIHGKAFRNRFKVEDIDQIIEYNTEELRIMVDIATQIRTSLDGAGIRLARFDGSGAIASAILRQNNIKEHLPEPPEDISRLAAFAFVGGRTECIKFGHSNRGGWQYDLNAAYPWALTQTPSWNGSWIHHKGDPGALPFTMYHVKWWGWVDPTSPAPLPWRASSNAVLFPIQGRGIIWSPEMDLLRNDCPGLLHHRVDEAWQFIPDDPDARPFAFMADLYDKRKQMAAIGDPIASVLKLGMAASWGKLAQRTGWKPGRIPTYHHLPAAGLATSIVRAAVWKAATTRPDDVIAIETDAVITRRRMNPQHIPIGNQMGMWKETRLRELTYAASGVSFSVDADGSIVERTSGVPAGVINADMIHTAWSAGIPTIDVTRNHFIGVAQCDLSDDWTNFRQWMTSTDAIPCQPSGKRIPLPGRSSYVFMKGWNPTFCPVVPDEFTHAYKVPWMMGEHDLRQWLRQEYSITVEADQP